jgi:hypothetical protein
MHDLKDKNDDIMDDYEREEEEYFREIEPNERAI